MPRAPSQGSHLRQVSAASDVSTSPESSTAIPSAKFGWQQPAAGLYRRKCTLWIHDEHFSKEEFLFHSAALGDVNVSPGDVIEILNADDASPNVDLGKRMPSDAGTDGDSSSSRRGKFNTPLQQRCLFVVKPLPPEIRQRHPKLEISVTSSVANIFGFKNRSSVFLTQLDRSQCSASHVDITLRDQFLLRADMWRLVTSELVHKTIYKGQKILFMGSIKATVKNIFIGGRKVLSGYFAPNTIPVFRSEAARYVLFIQMAREMWDFDAEGTGDILFSRVINGFLPELFKRWASIDAKHLVTIVLFTRVEYDPVVAHGGETLEQLKKLPSVHAPLTRDFYRVVVNDIASGHWTAILDELKKNFRTFLRDVSIWRAPSTEGDPHAPQTESHEQPPSINGRPTPAVRGNILEAIHLATSHLASDHIDRDLTRTGTSIIVITPGPGFFEVSYESLAATSESLTNLGIAIDLVSLGPMPLHSVPLFKYKNPHHQRQPSGLSVTDANGVLASSGTHPGATSYTSRASSLSLRSGSTDVHAAARPRSRHPSSAHSSECCYGIPHWVDISYWNPTTYREDRRITKKDLNAPIPYTVTRRSRPFVPRVRMYEIQMMGIMESEQSNFAIPYLSEKDFGFQRDPHHPPGLTPPPTARPPLSPDPSSRDQLSDSPRPQPFLSSITDPKEMLLRNPVKRQKNMLALMDEYDEKVFVPLPKTETPKKHVKVKAPPEPENHISSLQDRLSARSVSSLREHQQGSSPTIRKREVPSTPRGSTASPQSQSPRKSALKSSRTPRISRTISFALRGLGVAPPRAQPSTGLNAEHARALPMPSRTSHSGRLTPSELEIGGRPPSSDNDTASIRSDLSQHPPTAQRMTDPLPDSPGLPQSKPISIRQMTQKAADALDAERHTMSATPPPREHELPVETGSHGGAMFAKRTGRRFDMDAESSHDSLGKISPNKTLAPWVKLVNPSNTPKAALRDESWFGRWQHAYPRPPRVAVVKWKSLKTPAVLPLTTEEFPSRAELASDYLQTPYRVYPNDDEHTDFSKARDVIFREMVALRLSHGFQIVVGKNVAEATGQHELDSLNVFDPQGLARDGATIYLSKGHVIHRLVCLAGGEIEVTRYTRLSPGLMLDRDPSSTYTIAIRTILAKQFELSQVRLHQPTEEYNWNYADNYLASHRDHLTNPTEQLRFWRVRFVLIPMRLSPNYRRHGRSFNEDDEEETHIAGISELTRLWQRNRYVPPEERRSQVADRRKKGVNPLNIIFQTRDPSEVVAAERDRVLLTDPGLDNPVQLLPESELLEMPDALTPDVLRSLADLMQSDKGVRMMDRRWHVRLHRNCFVGSEFTTWLVQNYRDIDSREQAVRFGQELMNAGLFVHVNNRHNFRDGNYFYKIHDAYRTPRPESRTGWFGTRKPESVPPPTPRSGRGPGDSMPEEERARTTASSRDDAPSTAGTTGSTRKRNKATVMLSKSMKYDVDPRKRSHRPEVIDLHYDRLHNPDNCFHIELSWMNATPKLIEDAVAHWASVTEKHGLKLVQVPIAEASATVKAQSFRQLYRVQLKVPPPPPPAPAPAPLSLHATSFGEQDKPDRHFYQKALLKKFDFVLDFEAASAFPPDVEVLYSWGKPEYRYPQFIHRSGCLLAQISDEGDLLLLANRLFSTKSVANRDGISKFSSERGEGPPRRARAGTYSYDPMSSPHPSPALRPSPEPVMANHPPATHTWAIDSANLYKTPEMLKSQVEEFCSDEARLRRFYQEVQQQWNSAHAGPVISSSSVSSFTSTPATLPPSLPLALPAPPSSSATAPPTTTTTTTTSDTFIPLLELPASVIAHRLMAPPSGSSSSSTDLTNPLVEAANTAMDSPTATPAATPTPRSSSSSREGAEPKKRIMRREEYDGA